MATSMKAAGLAAILGLLATAGLKASTAILLTEDQMVDRADLIVRGVVLSVESAVRDRGVPVFTDVAVEVIEILKGVHPDPILHLALPGGELDGRVYQVAGTPTFKPGEEVVLFLVTLKTGERTVIGLRQGKYTLRADPATGQLTVERSLAGLHTVPVPKPGQTTSQALKASAADREAWDLLRQRIRSRVAKGPQGP